MADPLSIASTTGNPTFPECQWLRRVQSIDHMEKLTFYPVSSKIRSAMRHHMKKKTANTFGKIAKKTQ